MRVSVIVPCYNVEAYIEACIGSIENQTHGDLEVICVDDGSTDGTLALLKALQKSSALPIQVLTQENRGASSARNHGIRVSTGQYFQFLDADDLLNPGKIAHQVKLAKDALFPAVVVGSYKRGAMGGDTSEERRYEPDTQYDLWLQLMQTDLGNTCSNLFKADLFADGIAWNESARSSQEYDLMFQILKKSNHLAFDPEVLTHIRVRAGGSISQTNVAANWERYVTLRADILTYLKASQPEVLKDAHRQAFFDCIRMLYPYNQKLAVDLLCVHLPKDFKPQPSSVTSKGYIRLYNLFGFRTTERFRALLSRSKAT